jgi:HTH-type transcriptional regulator/antitoxin HigA
VKEVVPAEVFLPGEYIQDELEARGWSQSDLAEILGRPVRLVNELIAGKRGITPETARGLAEAFGTSAEMWLNLESRYQLSKVRTTDPDVALRAKLYELAPVKEMIRREWIAPSSNAGVLKKQLLDFFEIDDLEAPIEFLAAARKSSSYRAEWTISQRAWLFRARHIARGMEGLPVYSADSTEALLGSLRNLLSDEDRVKDLPGELAAFGIRFLILEALPQTKIDGVSFWLDESAPVMALSLRFDRIDYFWYTVMHELGHILKGHGQQPETFGLDVDLLANVAKVEEKPPHERDADAFAAETLVPQDELKSFIRAVRPHFSKNRILQFAEAIRVVPGIVVGQLQFRGHISYAHSREMLVKIRDVITAVAKTDGWGMLPT